MKLRNLWAASAVCLLFATIGIAASTIKLKNGSTIIGDYKKLGESYSIVRPDGSRTMVPASDIVSIDGKPLGGSSSGAAGTSITATTQQAAAGSTAQFKVAKGKADRVDAPIVAVQIWDDFLAKNPSSTDLAAAKTEREGWDKLYKDDAEKVKGKWLGGKELKDLQKKCDKLYDEAVDRSESFGVRGVAGLKKLDEIIDLYPRHFYANFDKGLYYLIQATQTQQGSLDALAKAVKSLERTTEIAPTVPEVWCNLAIGYNFQKKYQPSIECAFRAVKMRDDPKFVGVLATALRNAPPNIVNANPKVREINEQAQVLFRKYSGEAKTGWVYLRPQAGESSSSPDDVKGPPGVQWSGSGFFVSADGYLITNHHVAAGEPGIPVPKGISWRVRLDDGTEVPARLIGMDDKADIALMKIDLPRSTPFLKIAADNPEQGEEALVLGYPATGSREHSLQISKGAVKSVHPEGEYNVWFDLNTTHGNSGGPIVDRDGHVIGILTAGGKVYEMMLIYGVGPNQIEDFLTRLADKAPKLQYAKPVTAGDGVPLDSQKLTRECRKGTVLVLAVRGLEGESAAPGSSPATQPGAERTPGTPPKP